MKISVDKWILTTLKKSDPINTRSFPRRRSSGDLVIEQKVSLEQNLYQDGNTDESDKEIEIQHEKLNSTQAQLSSKTTSATTSATTETTTATTIDDKSFISCIDSNLIEASTAHCSYPTLYSDEPKKVNTYLLTYLLACLYIFEWINYFLIYRINFFCM